INLRRTRTAFAGFTIPAASQIPRLSRLDVMNRIQHYHPLRNFRGIINELPRIHIPTPDPESRSLHLFLSYSSGQTKKISVASASSCSKSVFILCAFCAFLRLFIRTLPRRRPGQGGSLREHSRFHVSCPFAVPISRPL